MFEDDISGRDMATFDATELQYFLCTITTVGGVARQRGADPDYFLRFGWLSFGYRGDEIAETMEDYWRPPMFLDFIHNFWTPLPQTTAHQSNGWYASRVRWSLSDGTEAHLVIIHLDG